MLLKSVVSRVGALRLRGTSARYFSVTKEDGNKFSLKAPRKSGTWPEMPAQVTGSNPDLSLISQIDGLKENISKLHKQAIFDEYLRGILDAQCSIYDVCQETDLQYAHALSELLGNEVYLKREDQQAVFSFKIRGAYNKIASKARLRSKACGYEAR